MPEEQAPVSMAFPETTAPKPFLSFIENLHVVEIMNRSIAYALILCGLLSVFFILYGGITLILSGGQDEKVKQAVSTIRNAILGLLLSILSVVAVHTLGQAFGVDIIQYINFSEIVQIIQGSAGSPPVQ